MFRDRFSFYSTSNLSTQLSSVANGDSSRRLAMGVAVGMMIGIIPKTSLLVWTLGILLMISTANLLTAAVSGFVISWLATLLDAFTHRLGAIVLTDSRLEPTWAGLYELPIVPWTLFNNTVVMGSLLTGIVLFIPVYLVSEVFFRTWGAAIGLKVFRRFGHTWVFRWLAPNPATRKPKQTTNEGETNNGAADQRSAAA